MINLKILLNLNYYISNLANSQQLTTGTIDFNNNVFKRKGYVFVYKEGDVFALNPCDGSYILLLSIKDLNDGNTLIAMFYNSVFNSLNFAFENGDVYSIALDDDLSPCDNEIQFVGSFGNGLQTAVLSPDTETIVFLTGDNTIILISGNFDPIDEAYLFGSDQGELDMVNVGWGKKETQFHGSEGKAAAKKKLIDEEINENLNLSELDRKPKISWRGDSTLFAVSYWCPVKNHQKVKIFNKTGHLQCTSEFLPGLEEVISWRPSGNLIALTQKLPNKHVICFMEKNGLRHGDFILPQNIKVMELSWNSESSILSGVCLDEAVNQHCVLLWTTGNYHWYLKQRLNFNTRVVAFCWDEMIGNLAYVLLADGSYFMYQWAWTVDHSAGVAVDDLAAVAVIDDCDIKLTAFKKAIIPPPMCSATIVLPSSALQVMFPPYCSDVCQSGVNPNDVCVYLSDGRFAFIRGMESAPQLHKVMEVQWKCKELPVPSPISLSHWLWLNQNELLCVLFNGASYLCHLQISDEAASFVRTISLDEAVLTVSHHTDPSCALVQLCTGALLVYQDGRISFDSAIPEPCVTLRSSGTHVFGRALNNHLYVDGQLIADNVTSFFCLPQFLIMTLSNHFLYVTSEDTDFKIQNDSEGTTSRRLERGSTVVVAVGHSVVLQLPRGNLETVQPRALTLVTAMRLLDAGDYKATALLLRRQRIDLNLCVDHNPTAFLLSVPRLVAQVREPQWLSVFLAELREQDVTRTMYAGYYKQCAGRSLPLADKVERVCTALREAMTQTAEDCEFFLQPILSTYVRTGRIGEAIALADSDVALSYLTLLIDTDTLFEEALAAYNLEKALKIAGKSLKDPKEYLTYLNELREMEPAYMRFTIDKRLRKQQSALHNLAQCSDRAVECLQYVQDTALFSVALNLFRDQPDMYKQVCLLYAAHLQDKRCYHEAGLMYCRGGNPSKAVLVFTKAGCWRQCLTLASQLSYNEAELEELHQTLYSTLCNRQELTEAAELCTQLGWIDHAIKCLVEAHSWPQAIYLCHAHKLSNIIESTVRPSLLECQGRSLADLRTKRSDLDKHSARLLVVRQAKANTDNNFDAMSDVHSDTSSLSSFSTSSAGSRSTSSKNTRKAQRKLWSLKEGNPREEQALLYTITELIRNTERLTEEVHSTCLGLAEFGLDSEAGTLHSAMTAALEHVEMIKHTIWPTYTAKKTGSDAEAVDPTPVDTQLSFPPQSHVSSAWKLHIYS